MFKLTPEEAATMRSQSVTASKRNVRFQPLAFTEHGVVMPSAVLNSERAIQMSILVVNAFVRMRELISSNKDLAERIGKLERGHDRTASVIELLVEDIDRLALEVKRMKALPEPKNRRIGFELRRSDYIEIGDAVPEPLGFIAFGPEWLALPRRHSNARQDPAGMRPERRVQGWNRKGRLPCRGRPDSQFRSVAD